MQKEENWNPGHAINQGYPYNGLLSRTLFSNRPVIVQDEENKVILKDMKPEIFGPVENAEQEREWMLHRLHDYAHALDTAENQIEAILTESPFIPEEFGFERISNSEEVSEHPIRLYVSKYDEGVSLYREIPDPRDPKSSSDNWIVMIKSNDATAGVKFNPHRLKLDSHRIAYATFYALGITMRPEQSEAATPPAPEEEDPIKYAMKNPSPLVFAREGKPVKVGDKTEFEEFSQPDFSRFDALYDGLLVPNILAVDENDARTKALFTLQTDEAYPRFVKEIDMKDIVITPLF